MANEEHLKILRQGVGVWNQWREDNATISPDLRKVNLIGANLKEANLKEANLKEALLMGAKLQQANLIDADLSDANLIDADLSDANLRNTSLISADLSRAVLTKSDLRGAVLHWTEFSSAEVKNANFERVELRRTQFCDNDLSQIIGLDSVNHLASSSIGIDTLQKSGGNISETFLRGCGLSDWQIESAKLYNPDLSNEVINDIHYRIYDLRVRQAFQINPLFISYSHINSDFVDAIEKHLIQEGVRFWRDIHHARAGKLERQIDAAIQLNDVVLLVLSEHSTSSDWVEHEARKAREKERKTGKDALCPVALDESWKTCRWPERLREQITEYNILDFSNWQDGIAFQKMFGRLLEGLNLFYK